MGLDSAEFRDACRMDSIEQLGLVLAKSICGAPIVGKDNLNECIQALPESPKHSCVTSASSTAEMFDFSAEGSSRLQVLLQAQVLIKYNEVFMRIGESMQEVQYFRTDLQTLLIKRDDDSSEEEELVGILHRDTAVSNLRFLNIFYGYSPHCFALAVNLLDRLLSRVKTHPRYLSCVATSCFYIAAKVMEDRRFLPAPHELVKLSQCGGTAQDLLRMERIILEKIQYQVQSVNALTFLQHFCELLACQDPGFDDHAFICKLIAKLEVLQCQFEFAQFKAETLALGLLSCAVQEDFMGNLDGILKTLLEVRDFCQISHDELMQCRCLITDFLNMYRNQRSKLPRLRLVWTVSRRTLNKMKPSTRILLDLEPIFEDEAGAEDSSDDAGPFDSENESEKNALETYSIARRSFSAAVLTSIRTHTETTTRKGEAEPKTGNDGNNNSVQGRDIDNKNCCLPSPATNTGDTDTAEADCSESFNQVHSNAAADDAVIDSIDM